VVENLYPKPKLLVLNYPNNPTTMCVNDVAFFDEVVRLSKRFGFLVIHDFAYGESCFDDYQAPSFLQANGAKDVGVEFITMSKAYNMAGWRIGFVAGNPEMLRALAKVKGYYDYGIFQAIQIASIIAMRECDVHAIEQARLYQRRRDVMVDAFHRIGWDEVEKPKAGMFVWAKVPDVLLQDVGTIELAMQLMEKAEVAVAPGRAFGVNGEGYLRLALVENELRIKQAVRQIGRALPL
ncbi:MAG: aminotransferase class I/II-fold pyridoxal phosphate-dependent enzyme, partial [Phycisphaerae bacterium]|nr:aminotransferase class I/II-fold pyridoxal phosphate-dependent enzyme [Phycisphaerae bacterium]